jgi:hypothetical protein
VISNVASSDAATSQRVDCAMWLPGQILIEITLAKARKPQMWGDGEELRCCTREDNEAKHKGEKHTSFRSQTPSGWDPKHWD